MRYRTRSNSTNYYESVWDAAEGLVESLISSPTCQHQSHEDVLQEAVVHQVPEPLEVGQEVVSHRRLRLQHDTNPGPELSYVQQLRVNNFNNEIISSSFLN